MFLVLWHSALNWSTVSFLMLRALCITHLKEINFTFPKVNTQYLTLFLAWGKKSRKGDRHCRCLAPDTRQGSFQRWQYGKGQRAECQLCSGETRQTTSAKWSRWTPAVVSHVACMWPPFTIMRMALDLCGLPPQTYKTLV